MLYFNQRGQALLIVVLVMVVSLTVALSVVSRSITNLRISADEESSQRAFSAAEAGIEKALSGVCPLGNCSGDFNADNKTAFNTIISFVEGKKAFFLNNGNPESVDINNLNAVAKDDGADVWLVDHSSDESINFSSGWHVFGTDERITVYWNAVTASETCGKINPTPAIEIIAVLGSNIYPKITRYGFDPCNSSRRTENKFTSPGLGGIVLGKTFNYSATIPIPRLTGITIRVIPLYADAVIAVKGCDFTILESNPSCKVFPKQGKSIESTGNSGETARKVTYFQRYPELPVEFFGYVLFGAQ